MWWATSPAGRVRHQARQNRRRRYRQGQEVQADRLPQTRWGAQLRPADQCQPSRCTNHEESQPAHLRLKDPPSRSTSTCRNMPNRRSAIARPGSTKWSRTATARTRAFRSTSRTASTARPATSRTRARTSPGCAAGRRRAELSEHVTSVAAFVAACFGRGVASPLAAFAATFGVAMASYDPARHHGPEAGWNPLAILRVARDRLAGRSFPPVPVTLRLLEEAARSGRWPAPTLRGDTPDPRA
jgi:hypothetical protein